MPVKSLDHIQLAMPAGREAEARAFYADLLGIPETPKPANLARRGGCWFELGTIKVHLGVEALIPSATESNCYSPRRNDGKGRHARAGSAPR